MIETEDDDEEEDAEEGGEHIRLAASQEDECHQSREATIKNRSSHLQQRCPGSLLP